MLTHMFLTRINHKTFCCNLFVVPPALYRTITVLSDSSTEKMKRKENKENIGNVRRGGMRVIRESVKEALFLFVLFL